jgi:integrase
MASRYVTRTGKVMWRATWTVSDKQRSKGSFLSEADAAAFEAPLRGNDGMGGFSPEAVEKRSQSTKLGAWLVIWWTQKFDGWTYETRRSYERAINGVIAPYLQNVLLYALTSPRVAHWRKEALADGYTPHQVAEAMAVLSSALSAAKEAGCVRENLARGVSKPKSAPPRRINPATPEDLERIRLAMLTRPPKGRFSALDALRDALAVSLGGYGGFRPSEKWAVKVEHVDFEAGGIWQEDVFAGELREGDNKTHTGSRFVDLWTAVMQDIATVIEVADLQLDDLLLGDEDGNVTASTHKNWRKRHFKPAKRAAAAGADPATARRILALTPYDLRHSVVSIIARAEGRDLREDELADRTGHTIETQRRIYRHVVRAQVRQPRISVERQIALAREKLGIAEAASACIDRIRSAPKPTVKLVDLQAERRRRRAA